jgi:hypothetical protein
MQYNIRIKHKPGILNKANALSRRPDFPQTIDHPLETTFPDSLFIQETSLNPLTIATMIDHNPPDHLDGKVIVPEDNELQRGVIS